MGYSRFANLFESRFDHFRDLTKMIGFLMSGHQTTKSPPPVKGTGGITEDDDWPEPRT